MWLFSRWRLVGALKHTENGTSLHVCALIPPSSASTLSTNSLINDSSMDVPLHPTYHALLSTYPEYISLKNITQTSADAALSHQDEITRTLLSSSSHLTLSPSSWSVTIAVLLVFVCSPMILIGNSLVLVATCRFKRLRTPSNYLVMSLATSDLGVGMFMPIGMYLELGKGSGGFRTVQLCLISYGVAISLCSVSVLVMVAIAVDRFTSLARPLRYNNLITHSAVERYIAVFWAYSSLVGFTPLGFTTLTESTAAPPHQDNNYTKIPSDDTSEDVDCSFGILVAKPVQLFMFCAVYGPSALVLLFCYGYIYFIARGHARAISEVRHSFHHNSTNPPRYGLALALTAGMFLILWLPFQLCMLLDVFLSTTILSHFTGIFLALPILASSAINPWIYGYRNAELRCAIRKVVDDLLAALGFTYTSHHPVQLPASAVVTAGNDASFINHVQRLSFSWNNRSGAVRDDDFLLVPIAKPESSGVESEGDSEAVKRMTIMKKNRMRIVSSKSMIESFAIKKGSSAMVIKSSEMIYERVGVVSIV